MIRSLTYFWRMNLAVALGAAVATAVLTGALLVGDSVRGSLRQLTLERLGEIDHALAGQRFFPADVVQRLANDGEIAPRFQAAPAIVLQGNAQNAQSRARATKVSLQGIDPLFANYFDGSDAIFTAFESHDSPVFAPAVINAGLQKELGVEVGDALLFHLKRWSDVPQGSLMSRKDTGSVVRTLRLSVAGIVPDTGVGRFSLETHQSLALNVFVPLDALQKALDQEGDVNSILIADNDDADGTGELLESALRRSLTAADLGFLIDEHESYLSVESEEFILKPGFETVLAELAAEQGAPTFNILTYLANGIRLGNEASANVPYSTVTALVPPTDEAFGGLTTPDGTLIESLADDEILLNEWTANDLGAAVGDEITLNYYVVGPREDLTIEERTFKVAGIVALDGLAADEKLAQEYPGIAGSTRMSDWDPPFPIDLGEIRDQDEVYWDEYRGTPKAFVSETAGRDMWRNRWGELTSIRVALGPDNREAFERGLVDQSPLASYGLVFQPVKELGLGKSGGATDFGGMFIGFSMFLIASAAMLAALLFSLGVEQRASEIGLRLAVGQQPATVRKSFLKEGALVAAIGGLVGLGGAIGYAALMMYGLRTWWLPAVGTSRLELFVTPVSLAAGYVMSLGIVVFAIWSTLRRIRRLTAPQLLARVTEPPATQGGNTARRTMQICFLVAGVLLGYAIFSGETTNPAIFFAVGPLLLIGALALFAHRLRGTSGIQEGGGSLKPGAGAYVRMAAVNSGRHRRRSLLAATLVASACFLIVTVASFHEGFSGDLGKDSGTGGYELIAESSIPIFQDLMSEDGRFDLNIEDDGTLEGTHIVPMRLLPGDDTSCLNLYQPRQPRVLAVPGEQVERGGFSFMKTAEDVDNPWTLLNQEIEPGVIPALGDANSTQWILKVTVGNDIELEDEHGETVKLRLMGTLSTSVFQSELLISEENFLKHFPSRAGFSYFLVDTPPDKAESVSLFLEKGLDSYGFDAQESAEKLASFHAVQNTYLATFQTVGGLGLLLGTVGLAVVLARNVLERRKELATLRAFGFRRGLLTRLVILENALLLLAGLAIGTIAALLTNAPHLLAEAANVPWSGILGTVLIIFIFGLIACAIAARNALRIDLLPALKADR